MKGAELLADDLDAELEILERLLAVAFLVIAVGDLAIGLGHAEPVAVLAKMFERAFGMVAADRIFAQLAVDAGEGDVDVPIRWASSCSSAFSRVFFE